MTPADLERVDDDVARWTPEELERDRELGRLARGVAAVNRAVDKAERRRAGIDPPTVFRLPGRVALELGLPVCTCGRGIAVGEGVRYRGELLHAECVAERLNGGVPVALRAA